ncbi:galactokinase-like isoform X2 [Oratosquilla oratoria]
MAAVIPKVSELVQKASEALLAEYGCEAETAVCAPGRVNIIGGHTDYNEGFVFPMALPLVTVVVGKKTSDGICCIKTLMPSADEPRMVEFQVPTAENPLKPSKPYWANYVKGVIQNFHGPVSGFVAVVNSSVPLGGGLSSSAALEVATYTFLEAITQDPAESLKAKALACQKAEHTFANMPCGIMDQFISTMGKAGNLLFIDCRTLESKCVALDDPDIVILITNSNVRHTLRGSEYPLRRIHCQKAAVMLGMKSLRDAAIEDLEKYKDCMSDTMYRHARHVITEIKRTQDCEVALVNKDYQNFGRMITECHYSLKNDFEVSCPELDELVALAVEVPGVFGSRLTGGGFGGCTITVVKQDSVDAVMSHIKEKYRGTPTFYVCQPSEGARILQL